MQALPAESGSTAARSRASWAWNPGGCCAQGGSPGTGPAGTRPVRLLRLDLRSHVAGQRVSETPAGPLRLNAPWMRENLVP